jgi:penicillin amidase
MWVYHQLSSSLPQLEGEAHIAGLDERVSIERDGLGVPTVIGRSRQDVSRALGFVHAQDRFFQMDLLRRRAAGELAELLGPGLLSADRYYRIHRFRSRARQFAAHLSAQERALARAYADGVNAGLDHLGAPPFEYLLLRSDPKPWQPEDIALVAYSMYLQLNDDRGRHESARGLVYDLLGPQMFEFLFPIGTEWDAPISGETFRTPPIPGPQVLNLRSLPPFELSDLEPGIEPDAVTLGSNNWAVSGRLGKGGGAILANDMHLSHSVPNIWYRASLEYPLPGAESGRRKVTGVSLPGTPLIIAGSNGDVAWGHTNTWGNWEDLVILDSSPESSQTYSTADGPRPFERRQELLQSSNGDSETLEVIDTIWGPVVDTDHRDRARALHWIAHEPYAVSFGLLEVETSTTVTEALDAASRVGAPPQNFVAADRDGQIGWTVMGPIPERFGFDGQLPTAWSDGMKGWNGRLESNRYPRLDGDAIDRLWTANARVVGGDMMHWIGKSGYRLGSRASQIRDNLQANERFDELQMLELQLDDRAMFLARWQSLLAEVLRHGSNVKQNEDLLGLVENWGGKASLDSVGYRAVREFRRFVATLVLGSITAQCKAADPGFDYSQMMQYEGPLWKIVSERPIHLLDSAFTSWDDLFQAAIRRLRDRMAGGGESRLAAETWGEYNSVTIRHPLSDALPGLGRWLDMPTVALPGDSHMPRFQSRGAGASERMVVSPGREQDGIFHMPTGQSGHPLSPHYGDSQQAWVEGVPSSFLPGPTQHTLVLRPD